jgi:UDP:flavonoid glycosyltransferase YjiC (YdhE family)
VRVLLCPQSDPGYLYPALAAGIELRRRGHPVHVLARWSAASTVAAAGLPLIPADRYGPPDAFDVKRWMLEGAAQYRAILRAVRDVPVDVLVTSVLCHGALLAAETLDLPVAVLGLTTHLGAYRYDGGEPRSPVARAWRVGSMAGHYARARERAGLPERRITESDDPLAGTVTLLRGDPELEYQGAVLPGRVRHVGPCLWEPTPDPDELAAVTAHLDRVGKPVVYVHLARIFDGPDPWPRLNATFTAGPFQAVVEQGRTTGPRPDRRADVLVVRKPWMGPLIDRAGLVATSATSAPVLGALVRGRPLAVSPTGSEQRLLAEACVRAGVAVRVPDAPEPDPAATMLAAWQHSEMRDRAGVLGARLAAADGARRAADAVEEIVACRPVTGPLETEDQEARPTSYDISAARAASSARSRA